MAIGAGRRAIRRRFLIELLVLTSMGGLVGATLGVAAAAAIGWKAARPVLIKSERQDI
jgi:putative ABC transport system permease protein